MKARTRRGRAIVRDRRRAAAAARHLRYVNGIYEDAYTESRRLAEAAYEAHTGCQMLELLADVLLVDEEEGEPCATPLTGWSLHVLNKYT